VTTSKKEIFTVGLLKKYERWCECADVQYKCTKEIKIRYKERRHNATKQNVII
jgi:hypothetical protein